MKNIKLYLNERFGDHFGRYKYHPQDKNELMEIIEKRIDDEGLSCDLNDIDVSKIEDMDHLFGQKFSTKFANLQEFNGDISRWDVSHVINMNSMFYHSKFEGDISKWDVSHVEVMSSMFYDSKFNGDINRWDVSNVKDMRFMFAFAIFNHDIGDWDVSNVEKMTGMFKYSFFNKDISKWKLSSNARTFYSAIFLESNINDKNKPKKL